MTSRAGSRSGATASDLGEVVRKSAVALGVIDATTGRFKSVNSAFASLFGAEPARLEGTRCTDWIAEAQREATAAVLCALDDGFVDSCHLRATLQVRDGANLTAMLSLRASDDDDYGRIALVAVVPCAEEGPLDEPWLALVNPKRLTFIALGHDWTIIRLSSDAAEVLGWDVARTRGTSLLDFVHPSDVAAVSLARGRASADRRAVATRVRLKTGESWASVRMEMSPICDHNPPRCAVAVWQTSNEAYPELSEERARRLEEHLWRIAAELRAADIGESPMAGVAWRLHPGLDSLSPRQTEIVHRLLRGQRVPAIARELYLSESTVRNHLSVIFQKFNVHSQSELIACLVSEATRTEG